MKTIVSKNFMENMLDTSSDESVAEKAPKVKVEKKK